MHERLLEAKTPTAMFDVLGQALLEQAVRPLARHPAVAFALREFQARPQAKTVGDVIRQVGLSPRAFIRRFSEEVGLTPKLFCRIRRFQEALGPIRAGRRFAWSDVALDCGYYDQAHLIRDFRAFSGFTPTAFLRVWGEHLDYGARWTEVTFFQDASPRLRSNAVRSSRAIRDAKERASHETQPSPSDRHRRPRARKFLETYFGLQGKVNPYTGESMEGGKENRNFTLLFDDDGLALTLMGAGKATAVEYPGYFHIGFIQENEERVNEIYRRLKDDGFDVEPPRGAMPGRSMSAPRVASPSRSLPEGPSPKVVRFGKSTRDAVTRARRPR